MVSTEPVPNAIVVTTDLQHLLNALLLIADQEDGFGLDDVLQVGEAWHIVEADLASHGFILSLIDGRRVYLE